MPREPQPPSSEIWVIVAHPFGDLKVPLEHWMQVGPGPRPGVRPCAAEDAEGRPLSLSVIPLRYRNTALSRYLISRGILRDPWSTNKADESASAHWQEGEV